MKNRILAFGLAMFMLMLPVGNAFAQQDDWSVTFQVDIQSLLDKGIFNTDTDKIYVWFDNRDEIIDPVNLEMNLDGSTASLTVQSLVDSLALKGIEAPSQGDTINYNFQHVRPIGEDLEEISTEANLQISTFVLGAPGSYTVPETIRAYYERINYYLDFNLEVADVINSGLFNTDTDAILFNVLPPKESGIQTTSEFSVTGTLEGTTASYFWENLTQTWENYGWNLPYTGDTLFYYFSHNGLVHKLSGEDPYGEISSEEMSFVVLGTDSVITLPDPIREYVGTKNDDVKDLTFNVDMGVQVAKGVFDPSENAVFIRANFNSWEGVESDFELVNDGNNVYSTTLRLTPGVNEDQTIPDQVVFKYYTDALYFNWEGIENREFMFSTVEDGSSTSLSLFGFDDDDTPVQFRDVFFTVDMSTAPDFNPDIDQVVVFGSFNDWSSSDSFELSPSLEDPMIYVGDFPIPGNEGDEVQYKFRILSGDDRELPNDGTEIIARELFLNRFLSLSEAGTQMSVDAIYRYEYGYPGIVKPAIGIAAPGDFIRLRITVGDYDINPFLYGVGFRLYYDDTVLEYVNTGYYSDLAPFEESIILVQRAGEDNDLPPNALDLSLTGTAGEGTEAGGRIRLFSIGFRVKDNAEFGETGFDIRRINAINSLGEPVELQFEYETLSIEEAQFTTVWPGDLDNDGQVSIEDVLPIGQYYGEEGFRRDYDGSMFFDAQEARVWEFASATYADATGDGYIDVNDVLPLGVNFGKTTTIAKDIDDVKLITEFEPLTIEIPILQKGDIFRITLKLGDEENPVDDLLGMAIKANISQSVFNTVDEISTGLLGESEGLITFGNVNKETNVVSFGATRTAQQGTVSGFGDIYSFDYEVLEDMTAPLSITIFEASISSLTNINRAPSLDFSFDVITSNESELSMLPTETKLDQNYPNPFNPSTNIAFSLAEQSDVRLEVFNALGQKVATIADKAFASGEYNLSFDASRLTSGLYIYRLTAGTKVFTRKMILVK